MTCLCEKIPSSEDLVDLDLFDTSFLILTGHVRLVKADDLFATVLKENKDAVLWGPQSRLLAFQFRKSWKKVGGTKFLKDVTAAFDLTGDITVNSKKINSLLKKNKNIGKKLWKDVKDKAGQALATAGKKSLIHFEKQRELAFKQDVAFDAFMADALSDHIQTFTEAYPDRILHGEVQRLVKIVEIDPKARIVDKAVLTERIRRIDALPDRYFSNVSDVHVGRMWTFTGLQVAQDYGVTEYIVIAQTDKLTCPVCRRLDGKHFSVGQAVDRVNAYLANDGDADALVSAFPFPRVPDIDNKSPAQVRSSGWSPPFHGNCRCDVDMLWKKGAVVAPAAPKPPPKPKLPLLKPFKRPDLKAAPLDFEKLLAGPEHSNSGDLKQIVEEKLNKRMLNLSKKGYSDYEYFFAGFKDFAKLTSYGREGMLIQSWASTSADDSPLALFMQRAAKTEFRLTKASTSHFSKEAVSVLEKHLKTIDKAKAMRGAKLFVRAMYNETQLYFKEIGISEMTVYRGSSFAKKRVSKKLLAAIETKRKDIQAAMNEAVDTVKRTKDEMRDLTSKLIKEKNPKIATDYANRVEELMRKLRSQEELADKLSKSYQQIYHGYLPTASLEKVKLQPMSSFSGSQYVAKVFTTGGEGEYRALTAARVPVERILSCPRTGFGCLTEAEIVVLGAIEEVPLAVSKGSADLSHWIDALYEVAK